MNEEENERLEAISSTPRAKLCFYTSGRTKPKSPATEARAKAASSSAKTDAAACNAPSSAISASSSSRMIFALKRCMCSESYKVQR